MAPNSDIRPNFIKWFRDVFGFSDQVATALYDDQLFKDATTIAEFGNSEVDSVCRTLRRDSNLKVAELSVTRLKLMTFWVRHQYRTSRVIGGVQNPLVRIDLKTLTLLKEQKRLEDGWAANNKEPEHQKQHHVPYSRAFSINGTFLPIHGIASTLWAFQYVFLIILFRYFLFLVIFSCPSETVPYLRNFYF
jgi:hypothetical protein